MLKTGRIGGDENSLTLESFTPRERRQPFKQRKVAEGPPRGTCG
jgi:hypothetical protein